MVSLSPKRDTENSHHTAPPIHNNAIRYAVLLVHVLSALEVYCPETINTKYLENLCDQRVR